jgi:hypothetical protein
MHNKVAYYARFTKYEHETFVQNHSGCFHYERSFPILFINFQYNNNRAHVRSGPSSRSVNAMWVAQCKPFFLAYHRTCQNNLRLVIKVDGKRFPSYLSIICYTFPLSTTSMEVPLEQVR